MSYVIIRTEFDGQGRQMSSRPTKPDFELRDDAEQMAEFDALRTGTTCGFDGDGHWWAITPDGRLVTFAVAETLSSAA